MTLHHQPNVSPQYTKTREQLRQLARENNVPRGRNTQDTINNLRKAGIEVNEVKRRKSKVEIIAETVKFYGEDPSRRATNLSGGCDYNSKDGKRQCAAGRCFNSVALERFEKYGGTIHGLNNENNIELDDLWKDEYKGHDADFWYDLQQFHDSSVISSFDSNGLTDRGRAYVVELLMKYSE